MDKLTEIMAHKRHEIAPLLRPVFADELQALNRTLPRPPSFFAALPPHPTVTKAMSSVARMIFIFWGSPSCRVRGWVEPA